MQNPYSIFPEIESSDLLLRKTKEEDLPDLLKIYSDKEAAKFFNSMLEDFIELEKVKHQLK